MTTRLLCKCQLKSVLIHIVLFGGATGDAIDNPFIIGSLPANVIGSTSGFTDDYDVACDGVSTSPDVVYRFAPLSDVIVDIDLCASSYDTKVFVFKSNESMPIACDDDGCGGPGYQSHLTSVVMAAGLTYYVVVDGYEGDFGAYDMTIHEVPPLEPCGIAIPQGAVSEGDDCGDRPDINGGCNEVPHAFGTINCGDIRSGTLWMANGSRDMDYYWHTFDADTQVAFFGAADFAVNLTIWDVTVNDCDAVGGPNLVDHAELNPCAEDTLVANLAPGDYLFVIGGVGFDSAPCAAGPYYYHIGIECDAVPPIPVPLNDECVDATAIGDGTYTFNNWSATTSGVGTHGILKDLFYCYTAPLDGEATFSLCGSAFDTKIAIWDGCTCEPINELGYDDDGCAKSSTSEETIAVVAGNTYLVQCGGYSPNVGYGELEVFSNPVESTEPGTNCDYPIVIGFTGFFQDIGQTTCGFGDDYSGTEMGWYDNGEDIIYELVITTDVCVDINVDPLGQAWTGCAIFSECPDVSVYLIDGIGSSSSSQPYTVGGVSLTAGTYYVMIDTWPPPDCLPEFDLTITETMCPDPAGDLCVDAIEVFDGFNGVFSNEGATHEDDSVMSDVWFKYTATCEGSGGGCLTFDLCDSDLDTKMAVYLAPGFDCSAMSLIAVADDECGLSGWRSRATTTGVTTGTEFLIRIGGYGGQQGEFVVNVECAGCGIPPDNDNCADLETYYGGKLPFLEEGFPITFTGTTVGATASDCAAMFDRCVWEAFRIDTCMNIELNYCGTVPAFGDVYVIMEAACPCNLDQSTLVWYEDYSWDACGDDNITLTFEEIPAGTYYHPVLWDYSNANGQYAITVRGEICLPYCESGSNSSHQYISRVELGSIDNSSYGNDYTDYTENHSTVMYRGGNGYQLTVESTSGSLWDNVTAFIDWDADYEFEHPDEWLDIVGNPSASGPFTSTISCPMDAIIGPTTLRVRLTEGYPAGPCGVINYGEVEDYRVFIQNLPCGDVNDDGRVDIADVNLLVEYYFYDPTGSVVILPITENGDINGDGCVNVADIVMLVEYVIDPKVGYEPICCQGATIP